MADCGASGTALDQATRAFLAGTTTANNGQAQKQIGNLLGHATLTGVSAQNVLPVARPDQVMMPNNRGGSDALLAMPSHHQQQQQQQQYQGHAAVAVHQQQRHPEAMMLHHNPNFQMQKQQHQMMVMQQQTHHHHHQMMMMQQQNQMMMHAQAQAMQHQEQVAQVQAKQKAHADAIEEADAVVDDRYTEEGNVQGASMDELATAWTEAEAQDALDSLADGNVQGASIESLAAAWAEAQDQYYQSEEFNAVEDPSDIFNSGEGAGHYATAYKFTNEVIKGKTEIPPDTNFMEQGIHEFKDGNLAEAIQSFEMELQINDPDNATAWRMLGRCHAENDQDREAIVCLETAVERDPFSPESQLALGVSYVNELNHVKALAALKSWITMNPKYAGMDFDAAAEEDLYGEVNGSGNGNDSEFQELQNLLLKALEFDDSDAADVWEALGVAANVSRDFETAIEALQKAIDARPDDYQLWNKLGATLANGNQSEKALPAYHKALQFKPKYARAWLNMAISHSNLQDFDEAARCYLQTLSLNPSAVHCWSYLRVALSCSERWDLIPFAASQNLDAFKESFDFVMYHKAV